MATKVKAANSGCQPDKETIRAATIKEFGTLNVEDLRVFNNWLLEEDKPTYKAVVAKLAELRHHRWAWWHVMASDNPNIDPSCSMSIAPTHSWPLLSFFHFRFHELFV